MHNKLKLAVLMGGWGCEREVSLVSGVEVLKNIDKSKYEVMSVDVPRELDRVRGCDLAFIILHGRGGEDGRIQGYLETLGIKYTGCGVLASAIGMNKVFFKRLMEKEGVLVPGEGGKPPVVVKPVCGGSSVGVSIVEREEEMEKAIILARNYDNEVLVEEYIKGIEVTCGVWGNREIEVLPVVEIIPKNKFFDYESKYSDGGAQEICPARFDKDLTNRIQTTARRVFEIIGGRGVGRVDMMVRNKEIYVLDINTLPGMTPNSLFPKEARAIGLSYSEMLDRIIELGLEKEV